ncbi:cytochrome c biogenesis protein [Marinirhabdus gelatinilytica]|uniref:Cytochrome c-type biogenesis protein CcsB n=1 Tax=Marinirhabdus gelatinilytica TaxID=1703343 RepID=A0A370QK30_9FLAO|nr:cytochrome c biogenesis protein CcsA [Marinirhabdus gelatinilytica]RDK88686.1 cytochrome c-type biogenesis protein CcsB [Marinirhabdus gelatinilytica]
MKLKKIIRKFLGTRAAGLYFILFAAAIGVATFIENDFGTSAAQKVVYRARWFELLLFLFGATIIFNIYQYRMIQQKKWALLLFHASIIVILIGAGVTRYFGFEGVMHIRENNTASSFLSAETFLKFEVQKDGTTYTFDEPVLFASLGTNTFEESYLIGNDLIEVQLKEFVPNPKQTFTTSEDGQPALKLVVAGTQGREEYFVEKGQTRRIGNLTYNFKESTMPGAINLKYEDEALFINSERTLTQTVMATQQKDTIGGSSGYVPLKLRSLYSDGANNFVFSEFQPNASVAITSEDPKVKGDSMVALFLTISVNGNTQENYVYGMKGLPGRTTPFSFESLQMKVSYGAREVTVPFAIQLKDFQLEKYPGTNSASSYASEVTVLDPNENVNMDYRIYMNNILDYDGYRFFQSSFDKDEKGTYLSVNSDWWGTIISYLGYALLTLGMIWTLFSKRTRFYEVRKKIKKIRAKSGTFVFILFCMLSASSMAQGNHVNSAVSEAHAETFSTVVVQDFKGRMKPVHTLSRELLRKISRKESWDGLTADQVLLSMFVNKQDWYGVKLVKLGKNQEIQKLLNVSGDYASYKDFFDTEGQYKLRDEVRRIYAMEQKDRGTYAKELIKIDERLNILSMVFSGSLLKIIPNPNNPNNTWEGYTNHGHDDGHNHSAVASKFFNAYGTELKKATQTNNYTHVGHLLEELKAYQKNSGGAVMPSEAKINTEIALNKMNVFSRLAGWYMLLALALLFFLFVSVFKPNWKLKKIYYVLFGLVVLGFVLHTIGLGMRWYVSGRAPWSNGYESMIYIAWTSTLAGILFTRKSFGGLAATMVLAGTILFVSMLSFLDPEITPLVPVLKSYWLTIHVSLEAGSYGFLMLGAIIGLINLILLMFISEKNKTRVKRIVQEMSYISELTLIGGLFMVSVGTYLGGVWANESWGRYWGWDAKETWALVTILVYAFILHMRLIPKLRGLFAYNVATIFGLASVIMTYYGVNYYLSGLHSYATGDPVPIPNWVYVAVAVIICICIIAFIRKRKYPIIS